MLPTEEKHRKPRSPPAPYKRRPNILKPKENLPNNAKSSAKAPESSLQENLTLQDWMTVVNYYDNHQLMSQQELVHYFTHHAEGTLIFNQSTLSWHLSKKGWDADQHRLKSFLTALSSERIWTVVALMSINVWYCGWSTWRKKERRLWMVQCSWPSVRSLRMLWKCQRKSEC